MIDYQREFIRFALENGVLCFGEFTLKSGRVSPYFFNSGLFNNGNTLSRLGYYYAHAIMESNIEFDMLFGPAYKGIPLASATAIALDTHFKRNVPYAFNRKEEKDHGEGGIILGAPVKGNVLIIDDVITAGTSANFSVALIRKQGAKPAGIIIAMDRQETGTGGNSAVQEVEQAHQISVINIIKLEDIIDYLHETSPESEYLKNIEKYRDKYGIK